MKQQTLCDRGRQQGIALPTTMIVLFLAALAGLYAAKTSMKEQMVTADHYRSEQAFAMAQAGVDAALERHNNFGPSNPVTPDPMTPDPTLNFSKGEYTVMFCDIWDDDDAGPKSSALLMKEFLTDMLACTNPLTAEAEADGFANDTRVGILSVGKPDDASGRRTISLVSAPARVIGRDGPPLQPLIAKSTVDVTGDMRVINRYTNANVWSGGPMSTLGNMQTYISDGILDPDTSPRQDLINPDESVNALQASGKNIGANSDVIDTDYNLDGLTDDQMFAGFFADERNDIKLIADVITDIGEVAGKSGLVWLDGTQTDSVMNGQIGGNLGNCADPPALDPILLIVELNAGDTVKFAANTFICGVVFVFGNLETVGTLTVSGSMISTGTMNLGAGGSTIVYDPDAMSEPPEGFKNSRGVDAGTWKDWAVN